MSKKIRKYLVVLLKRLKQLIPLLPSCEVESVFKSLIEKFKTADSDEVMSVLCSFFLMVTSLGLLGFMISLIVYFGGF